MESQFLEEITFDLVGAADWLVFVFILFRFLHAALPEWKEVMFKWFEVRYANRVEHDQCDEVDRQVSTVVRSAATLLGAAPQMPVQPSVSPTAATIPARANEALPLAARGAIADQGGG